MQNAPEPAVSVTPTVRHLVPWAWVALLCVAAFGLYLRLGSSAPLGLDEWWHGVAGVTRGSSGYAVAVFMAEVGSGVGSAALTAIAAALLFALKRPRDAASVATALIAGVATSELIKALVMRPRPWDQLFSAAGSSYPSGHSMGAAALAVSLALVAMGSRRILRSAMRWVWIAAACWIIVMMWSRTALHVHWFSDTVAGALLGCCAAVLARQFWLGGANDRHQPVPQR